MIKIDLGCGKRKPDGYIGVDIIEGVDVVHDCSKGLPFEDNHADEIRAYDFLEHIQDKHFLISEIWRVLKDNGVFNFQVPDASKGQGAFQDPTHKSYWVENSFKYYENDYYRDLYGFKPKFRIEKLDQRTETIDYWGEITWVDGQMIALKNYSEKPIEVQSQSGLQLRDDVVFLIDDICPSNLKHWKYMEELHVKYPNHKVVAFVIANNENKEDISKNQEFKKWYESVKDWIEIGIHGYDHMKPQEGWRDDQEKYMQMSLDILKPYLSERFLYRAPGFRTLAKTEQVLKKLGFTGIAHQARIKYFNTGEIKENIFNLHCSSNETFVNPITLWKKFL